LVVGVRRVGCADDEAAALRVRQHACTRLRGIHAGQVSAAYGAAGIDLLGQRLGGAHARQRRLGIATEAAAVLAGEVAIFRLQRFVVDRFLILGQRLVVLVPALPYRDLVIVDAGCGQPVVVALNQRRAGFPVALSGQRAAVGLEPGSRIRIARLIDVDALVADQPAAQGMMRVIRRLPHDAVGRLPRVHDLAAIGAEVGYVVHPHHTQPHLAAALNRRVTLALEALVGVAQFVGDQPLHQLGGVGIGVGIDRAGFDAARLLGGFGNDVADRVLAVLATNLHAAAVLVERAAVVDVAIAGKEAAEFVHGVVLGTPQRIVVLEPLVKR